MLGAVHGNLSRIVVTHVSDGTFHAACTSRRRRGARPRSTRGRRTPSRRFDGSTIYVERVLDEAGVEPEANGELGEDDEKLAVFRDFVNSLDVDLGPTEGRPPAE